MKFVTILAIFFLSMLTIFSCGDAKETKQSDPHQTQTIESETEKPYADDLPEGLDF